MYVNARPIPQDPEFLRFRHHGRICGDVLVIEGADKRPTSGVRR
jgi:hypothetical protein